MITELTIALVQTVRKTHADLLEDLHDDDDDDDGDEHDGEVVAVVAVGAGWFFFFNNDITGTWVAEESGTTVEAVFDQGGTGTMTLYDAGKSTDNVDFTYEMNDGYLLIQTKTTLYKFGRTVRVPCEIHGNTMIWDPDGDNVTFTRQ